MCTLSLKRALSKNHRRFGRRLSNGYMSPSCPWCPVKLLSSGSKICTMRKEECFTAGCGLARPTAPNSPNLATHYNLSCMLPCILLLPTQPNSETAASAPGETIPHDGSRVKGPCHIFFLHIGYHSSQTVVSQNTAQSGQSGVCQFRLGTPCPSK